MRSVHSCFRHTHTHVSSLLEFILTYGNIYYTRLMRKWTKESMRQRERRENYLKVLFGDAKQGKKRQPFKLHIVMDFRWNVAHVEFQLIACQIFCDVMHSSGVHRNRMTQTRSYEFVCVCVTPANDTIFNCIKIIDVSLLQLNIFPFLSAFLCKCAAGIRISFSQFQRRLILLKHVIALDRKCAPSKWI